jgi:LSD1 subclass zinc finger protein
MPRNINKDLAGHRTDRSRHQYGAGRKHGLLIGDICNRIGRGLTDDQLLDRKRTPIGINPPDAALLSTSHHDHLADRGSDAVRLSDRHRMIGQHQTNLPHLPGAARRVRCSICDQFALVS